MLWAATGARNTLYLQGSVHLMKPDAYPLPAVMEAAFATSAVLVTDFADFPRLKQTLLTDRNVAWTAAFEQYLQEERDVVAVVGVAHLIGPEGVVALLRQRGYTVRQL